MTSVPAVPGAINAAYLTGNEVLSIAGGGPQSMQATTRQVASLSLSPTGRAIFVNETTGSDTTGNGSVAAPYATLAAAHDAATANNGDIVYFWGTIHLTSTLVWSKNGVSLEALNPPSANNRGRLSSSGTVFTPMVQVTAQGCAFINVGTFYGFDSNTAQVCWEAASGRNCYNGCQFFGGGHATAAAHAGMRSLLISGTDGENIFVGCTIGLDTVVRATGTNASLEFTNHTCRNEFYNCVFRSVVSNTADLHVLVGSGGIDRYALFKGCTFLNAINSGGSAMAVAFTVNASAGGSVLLQGCTSLGATVYATTGPIYVDGAVPTGNTSGLAVAAT